MNLRLRQLSLFGVPESLSLIAVGVAALVVIACAAAQPTQPPERLLTSPSGTYSTLSGVRAANFLTFAFGLKINLETGEADYPKTMKLSDVARAFWFAVADAYPNVRYDLMHPPISSNAVSNSAPGRFELAEHTAEVGRIEFGSAETSVVRMVYKGADVLTIAGLPRAPQDEVRKYDMRPFIPPEAPEPITVELTTKDGKVWRAKWEEKR